MEHFRRMAAGQTLFAASIEQLQDSGFVIIPGPIAPLQWPDLCAAYDRVMNSASAPDFKLGSTSARLYDFVNRGSAFDAIYLHPPLLEACAHLLGEPFKLSASLGRTLLPHTPAQALHADLPRDSPDAPMVGFILMVDAFRRQNGATRFVPTSQRWADLPQPGTTADEVLATGPAGSMIVFNAAIWHGHAANTTATPRRSIQGYFVRRSATSTLDFRARTPPETVSRLSPLARELLCL